MQICTSNLVYFYQIDNETMMPYHVGTMFNFIPCSHMLIGLLDQRCIAYKINEKNIRVFMRRHVHGFHHMIHNTNRENCIGKNLTRHRAFLVTNFNEIIVHCAEEFIEQHKFFVPCAKTSNTPEKI